MVSVIATTLPMRAFTEGTVKQALLTARLIAKHGGTARLASPYEYYEHPFSTRSAWKNPVLKLRARVIHYYAFPNKTLAISLLLSTYEKAILTVTDALLGAWWKDALLKPFLPILCTRLSTVIVQTRFQAERLPSCLQKKARVLPLLIPPAECPQGERSRDVLVMTSLREEKGVGIMLEAFTLLHARGRRITLTLANSGFRTANPRIVKHVHRLAEDYPDHFFLKGRIDPYEELARHKVYAYPFPSLNGNFATPLSAYEAAQCGTPFLLPDHEPLREAFPSVFLVTPTPERVAERLDAFLSQPPPIPPLKALHEQRMVEEALLSLHGVSRA